MCVPQRRYSRGIGSGDPKNRGLEIFLREDGSYLPVRGAVEGKYDGLMNKDSLVLVDVGNTVMTRFEVNRFTTFVDHPCLSVL